MFRARYLDLYKWIQYHEFFEIILDILLYTFYLFFILLVFLDIFLFICPQSS